MTSISQDSSQPELHAETKRLKEKVKSLEQEKELFIESSYDGYWDWHLQEDYEK